MNQSWTCRIPASCCGAMPQTAGRRIAEVVEQHLAQHQLTPHYSVTWQWGTFQERVKPWMMACFGPEISGDIRERCHRFFEEAGELCQAAGMSAEDAFALVAYTWGRPVGKVRQEVGGVMTTLAALCLAAGVDMDDAADEELARIWMIIDIIRAKQQSKRKLFPNNPATPLPGAAPDHPDVVGMVDQKARANAGY